MCWIEEEQSYSTKGPHQNHPPMHASAVQMPSHARNWQDAQAFCRSAAHSQGIYSNPHTENGSIPILGLKKLRQTPQ